MNVRPLATLALTIVALTAACSSSSATALAPDPGPDAGSGGDGSTAGGAWLAGECGACVQNACTPQRQVCDAEPSCALHGACADGCVAVAGGTIDAACLAACPRGDNAVASRARAAYDACITGGGLAGCAACTKPSDPGSFTEILDQKCAGSAETNPCFKCEAERCCETYDACVAEPECKQQLQPCLVACKGDHPCEGRCYADHPKGVGAWARRATCIAARCATECGAAVDACVTCGVTTTCREPNARCAADAGCFLLKACLAETCPTVTDACISTCKAKVPATAGPLFDAWFNCISLSCVAACQ